MTGKERRFWIIGILGALILRILGATLRFEVTGAERWKVPHLRGSPVILVLWHAWMLPLIHLHRGQGIVILASDHGDGEYISQVASRMGLGSARGSSTRGGEKGLRGLLRSLRDGKTVAITPDGPRGPARKLKDGVLVAGQLSGADLVPIAVTASSSWRLSSWDRFVIPKPFSRVLIEYGGPWQIARDVDDADMTRFASEIESFLNAVEAEG
jgi:lysophospholipid acyltransferase (LPLAT)-like uncharacterized protein